MTKLIIVAAGTGSRLMPLTKKVPKPLAVINGKTILAKALEQIKKSGVIDEVIHVVGYKAEQIEAALENTDFPTKTIYNPYYDTSGNLHSLWFAHNEMDGDIMITNADNIINASVYKRLAKEDGITLAVCKNEDLRDDDAKVIIEGDEIINVSKEIPIGKSEIESVSLLKVSKDRVDDFRNVLDGMVREKEFFYDVWLAIFFRLYKEGIYVKPMDIQKKFWKEVDYHSDMLEVIKKELGYSKRSLSKKTSE